MSAQQISTRTPQEMVALTQQMQQFEEIFSQMRMDERANINSAIDVVDAALQKEIDALERQVDALKKTVAVSQKTLAASQTRAIENPKMYAAKRQAEKTMEEALKRQAEENRRQTAAMQALYHARQLELEGMRGARYLCSIYGASPWTENKFPLGMQFIRVYVGETVYKTMINQRVRDGRLKGGDRNRTLFTDVP